MVSIFTLRLAGRGKIPTFAPIFHISKHTNHNMVITSALTTFGQYCLFIARVFSVPDKWKVFFRRTINEITKLGVDSIPLCNNHIAVYRRRDRDPDAAQHLVAAYPGLLSGSGHTRHRAPGVLVVDTVSDPRRQSRFQHRVGDRHHESDRADRRHSRSWA